MVNRRFGKEMKKRPSRRSSFVYKPSTSAKSMKERANRQGGRFDSVFKNGFEVFRPKDGGNVIRILPPTWEDYDHFGFTVWVHGYVGVDNGSYICLNKNDFLGKKKGSCPICAAAADARKDGDDDDEGDLKPKEKLVYWVIDRNRGEDQTTPKLWLVSWSMDRDIAALCYSERNQSVIHIDHPDEGFDLSFRKTGQKLNTRYIGMQVDRDPTPIADDEKDQDEILEYITENPIPKVLLVRDAAYLEQQISATSEEADEDLDGSEDEDDRSSRRRSRDEEEDGGEEEEETRPTRRRSRDEEDDEPPPRRKKPARDEEEDEEQPPEEDTSEEGDEYQDEEGGGEEEEEAEETRPARRRARDEEEEDEPAPRRRRARDEEEEDEPPRDRKRPSSTKKPARRR